MTDPMKNIAEKFGKDLADRIEEFAAAYHLKTNIPPDELEIVQEVIADHNPDKMSLKMNLYYVRRKPDAPIIVDIDGGLIRDVHNIPPGFSVHVRDFDISEAHGCEGDEEIEKLPDGTEYCSTIYSNNQQIQQDGDDHDND